MLKQKNQNDISFIPFQEVSNIWEEYREFLSLPNQLRKCMVEILAMVADPLTQNVFLVTRPYPQTLRQQMVSIIVTPLYIQSAS